MRGFLPKATATDGCFGSAIGSQMHTVDISANREISSQTTSISFDNETRELADTHCQARYEFYGEVVNSSDCRNVKDASRALWRAFEQAFPLTNNSLCQVHGQRLLQAKAGDEEAAKYMAAVYAFPQSELDQKKHRYVVTITPPSCLTFISCLFSRVHFLVISFNTKTKKVLEHFAEDELFLLNHAVATGIATQNHAESFNKLALDVRQLNPVLQLESLLRRQCKQWNDEYERSAQCKSILPPGLTSKATYKKQVRLAA